MGWDIKARQERSHNAAGIDQRKSFGRDRDRILYSSAFHRLAGITQVVRAGEAEYFHTRQQHTLKVAQVGRRLAEFVITKTPRLARTWGVHPEVVEAACLAHDLGHPPFGHIGEHTLNRLVEDAGDFDGFEGNAQSFRIATRIGVRFDQDLGFDLTRATLAAILKYPWLRDLDDRKKSKKWSCYESDKEAFEFARKHHAGDERQTAEAALMDWADDIAYSVHDLEDFHRAGVIPWRLIFNSPHTEKIIQKAHKSWFGAPSDALTRLREAMARIEGYFATWEVIIDEPYDGSRDHRVALRALTSTLIGRYVQATSLNDDFTGNPVIRGDEEEAEIYILKQITRDYVITSPSLLAQQHGQQRIIQGLYNAISEGAVKERGRPGFLPVRLTYLWDLSKASVPRFAADCIAGLTEGQATALYGRLYGTAAGSVLDPIVR